MFKTEPFRDTVMETRNEITLILFLQLIKYCYHFNSLEHLLTLVQKLIIAQKVRGTKSFKPYLSTGELL